MELNMRHTVDKIKIYTFVATLIISVLFRFFFDRLGEMKKFQECKS